MALCRCVGLTEGFRVPLSGFAERRGPVDNSGLKAKGALAGVVALLARSGVLLIVLFVVDGAFCEPDYCQ